MEKNIKKLKKHRVTRVSKSGRVIKTPKAVLTTSSDENPPRPRSSKKLTSVRSHIQRLREVAKTLNAKKNKNGSQIEDTEDTMGKSCENASAGSTTTDTNVVEAKPEKAKEYGLDLRDSESEATILRRATESAANGPKSACLGSKAKSPDVLTKSRSVVPRPSSLKSKTTETGSRDSSYPDETITNTNIMTHNRPQLSPPPSINGSVKIIQQNMDVDGENALRDSAENFEDCETVNLKQVLDSLKIIQEQNGEIKEQNQKIINQQQLIIDDFARRNVSEEMSEKLYEPLEGFPLKTVEDFEKIDCAANKNIRKKLYRHLRNLGGTKMREFLNCALKETMSDELVNSFTWPGGKSSQKFGDTKISNVLYLAAKNCPQFRGPDNKAEFKAEMLEVLRTTKQRFRKVLKKSQPAERVDGREQNLLQEIRRFEDLIANDSSDDEHVDGESEAKEDFDADSETDIEEEEEQDFGVDNIND